MCNTVKKDEPVMPTFEGFCLIAARLHGHSSRIFEVHRRITEPIKHNKILKLHCIVGGIVTEFEDGQKYRLTLEVLDG